MPDNCSNLKIQKGGREGIYLFCFARRNTPSAIEGKGVDGQNSLFLWNFLDIAAVLSVISLEDFCGPLAESRMQDLSWVGPRASRHEEVVEQVMHRSPVLPIRFGTIFSSIESLEERLKRHYSAISRFLDRVADKDEWAVKGLLDRTKAREQLFSRILDNQKEKLSSSPGKRYFQEQRIRASVEKKLNHWLKGVCKEIVNNLNSYALDFYERRVLSSGDTGSDMVLNWAFLVPRSAVTDFRAQIDQANIENMPQGLVVGLSGPWPPYSFSPSLETEPKL